jgi:hypothetical protein
MDGYLMAGKFQGEEILIFICYVQPSCVYNQVSFQTIHSGSFLFVEQGRAQAERTGPAKVRFYFGL